MKVTPDRYITTMDLAQQAYANIRSDEDMDNAERIFWGIYKRARGLRTFVVDADATYILLDIAVNDRDLILDNLEFAKPPYPQTYVEFDPSKCKGLAGIGPVPEAIGGLLVDGDMMSVYRTTRDGLAHVTVSPAITGWDDLSIRRIVATSADIETLREQAMSMFLVLSAFFLLLHKPKMVSTSFHGQVSFHKRGRRVTYMAHHVVRINLSGKQVRRHLASAYRAPARAHEVRGCWVNYHKRGNCEHAWKQAANWCEETPRYDCTKCGQHRVWRRHHVRGDAGKGWINKDYAVTYGKGAHA